MTIDVGATEVYSDTGASYRQRQRPYTFTPWHRRNATAATGVGWPPALHTRKARSRSLLPSPSPSRPEHANDPHSDLVARGTFLELCKRLRAEAGLSGSGPSTVINQTGHYGNVVRWVQQAYSLILKLYPLDLSVGAWDGRPGRRADRLRHLQPGQPGSHLGELLGQPDVQRVPAADLRELGDA